MSDKLSTKKYNKPLPSVINAKLSQECEEHVPRPLRREIPLQKFLLRADEWRQKSLVGAAGVVQLRDKESAPSTAVRTLTSGGPARGVNTCRSLVEKTEQNTKNKSAWPCDVAGDN